MRYANINQAIGLIVSRGLAKLYELQTVYGGEDMYNLLEIIAVDDHNQRAAAAAQKET